MLARLRAQMFQLTEKARAALAAGNWEMYSKLHGEWKKLTKIALEV